MKQRSWTALGLLLVCGLAAGHAGSGCSSTSSPASPVDGGQPDTTSPGDTGLTGVGEISGTVKDLSSKPVAGIKVTAGSASATTAGDGTYSLSGVAAGPVIVSYANTAYLPSSESVTVVAGKTATQNVVMAPMVTPLPLSATTGGTVRGLRGATLTAEPNAFVDAAGKAVTGSVDVFLRPLDPAISQERNAYPGSLVGVSSSGAMGPISPFGTLEVTVEQNGAALQVASGKTLTIKIPATAAGGAASTGDLWSFEPASANWLQEGTATLAGGFYTATLHHLCYHTVSCQDMGGTCESCGGNAMCGDGCTDTDNDPNNCGACGNVCPDLAICVVGMCSTLCASGSSMCDGECVDSDSDSDNCGSCGNACPEDEECIGGTCVACGQDGTAMCGSDCIDIGGDPYNCGACDTACAAGATCEDGVCKTVPVIVPPTDAGPPIDSGVPAGMGRVTLTGPVSGTFNVSVTAAWAGSNNETVVAFSGSALPPGVMEFAASSTVSGQLATMAYPLSSFKVWSTDVLSTGETLWSTSNNAPTVGTQSLTITSSTVTFNAGQAMIYAVHGSFAATLPYTSGPDAGSDTNPVTVTIVF